ncbi:LysE/ArgO family amino acid transporter [Pseudolysinimonas sp.]|uniref:LysE/ArgO family amino acid transporter n=1 Tax=Pseudolysinimonas sp. TaxID=2680009 RepID=UPI003F7CEED7
MLAALTAALAGLALGASLIVAIGAQNAFVLRQGLRREHVALVVAICAGSDVVLIALGVGGAGTLVRAVPWLIVVARIAGAAFLAAYGVLAVRRAIRAAALVAGSQAGPGTRAAVVAACLAFTWLNPGVYLDTVVLVGSIAGTHGDLSWAFGVGAAMASILWFSLLGFGARALGPVFRRPLAWRVLDAVIAAVMFGVAVSLVLPLLPPLPSV